MGIGAGMGRLVAQAVTDVLGACTAPPPRVQEGVGDTGMQPGVEPNGWLRNYLAKTRVWCPLVHLFHMDITGLPWIPKYSE